MLQYDIEQQQTLLFEKEEIPLSSQQWRQLELILVKSQYQHIIAGDAEESHSVWVSRYYNDVESPQALNAFSKDIKAIVMSEEMRAFYQRFIGTNKVYLRRCQANRLAEGDFIGVHKDQDSSPDYFATIVFHFNNAYKGGYFQTEKDGASGMQRYKPSAGMALVNNCSISHQVTPVESGERLTLACFLSTSFEPNKTSPHAFKVKTSKV